MTSPPRRSSSSMTAWKTRPSVIVSSSAPRCEPSSLASASVSGVKPEMSAKIAEPAGRSDLDAAGGAIVVNIGHGRASVGRILGEQAARLSYAHGSAFTTEPLEAYAAEIGPRLPVADPAMYPVSGGSEAIETALKLA